MRRYFQRAETTEEAKRVLLLALFSSPSVTKSGRHIPQLQLMKEIHSCIEKIPHRLREIRPAARFPADIVQVSKLGLLRMARAPRIMASLLAVHSPHDTRHSLALMVQDTLWC